MLIVWKQLKISNVRNGNFKNTYNNRFRKIIKRKLETTQETARDSLKDNVRNAIASLLKSSVPCIEARIANPDYENKGHNDIARKAWQAGGSEKIVSPPISSILNGTIPRDGGGKIKEDLLEWLFVWNCWFDRQ